MTPAPVQFESGLPDITLPDGAIQSLARLLLSLAERDEAPIKSDDPPTS